MTMDTVIQFKWNSGKAIQATAYLVGKLGQVTKLKLVKLLYIADRDHFLQHGTPITGDKQYALPLGPVPSRTLDMLNGQIPESEECYRRVHQDDYTFTVKEEATVDLLSESELAVLDAVLKEHGNKSSSALVKETHEFPEYKEMCSQGPSVPITYETILRCHETGDGRRFRHNRPVVSRETIANMECPFPPWQPLKS